MVRLTAGWARQGKSPRSFQDYAILDCGGTFAAADYAAILERYAVGNPPPVRAGAEALPWITLSEVQDDRHSYLGVSVQFWTGDADGAGRPIAETVYGCFPYRQFLQAPVSYHELWTALDRLGRSGRLDRLGSTGSDGLDVTGYAPEDHVRDLEDHGWYGRAALAAAMLLEGPVTVTGAGELDADTRVRFLDAVAALLPYGWRPRFTAATWFRGGSPYIQLAFAQHPRDTGFDLDWRAPVPAPPAGADVARAYLRELTELLDHRGRGLLEVLAFLSRQTESLAGRDPGHAVEVLERLDWPATVLSRAGQGRAGGADLAAVAAVLDSGRYTELPRGDDHVFLLRELIRSGDPAFAPVVEKVWPKIGAGSHEVWRALADTACGVLRVDVSVGRVERYLEMAERLGFADELLAELLRCQRPGGAAVEAGHGGLVSLVSRWADPAGPPRPRALSALGANPAIACALVTARFRQAPEPAGGWWEALEPVLPDVLTRPLRALLFVPALPPAARETAEETAAAVTEVTRRWPDCLPALLRLATQVRRLEWVIPPVAGWLAGLPEATRRGWAEWLATLSPASAGDEAARDVVLLCLRAGPLCLASASGPEQAAYLEAFRRHVTGWRPELVSAVRDGLVGYLARTEWAADPVHIRAALGIAETVASRSEQDRQDWSDLARAVIRGRAINPHMTEYVEYRRWWPELARAYPEVVEEQDMTIVTALPRDAPAERIGHLVAEALWRGASHRRVLWWLERSEARPAGARMVLVVAAARRALTRLGATPDEADRHALRLGRAVMCGEALPAGDFRDAAVEYARSELAFHIELVRVSALRPPELTRVELGGRARSVLTEVAARVRTLLRRRGVARFFGGG